MLAMLEPGGCALLAEPVLPKESVVLTALSGWLYMIATALLTAVATHVSYSSQLPLLRVFADCCCIPPF
jgi:hypothetical protein